MNKSKHVNVKMVRDEVALKLRNSYLFKNDVEYNGFVEPTSYKRKIKHRVSNNFGINNEITYITKIDGRKMQWIALIKDEMVVFGKLQTRKKNINACKNIKIIHYRTNGNTKRYLQMIECKDPICSKEKLVVYNRR